VTDPAIYLDHHAHTPLDPYVRQTLVRAWDELDVNVHAATSSDAVRLSIDDARRQIAELLGASAAEIVFTSGATEANNLAICGLAEHLRRSGRKQLVVSAGEHPSVLNAAQSLRPEFEVVIAPLLASGEVDMVALDAIVTEKTGLVSIAAANHEIGTVQPLAAIAKIVQSRGALFHSDLAQAFGKIPVELSSVHLASISAHKLYGPLGIGGLMVRRSVRRLVRPLLHGGGQEAGLRPGTLPAPLCVAFGAACCRAQELLLADGSRLVELRNRLLNRIASGFPTVRVNGRLDARLPGNLNLCFPGVDAEALMIRLRGVAVVATGSACNAQSLEPSHVLTAIGLSRADAESSIRIGLGRTNSDTEIDRAADHIVLAARDLSALRMRART